jgi:hypothetical protein
MQRSIDFDSVGGTTATVGNCGDSTLATGDLYFSEFDTTNVYADQYKEEEEDFWMIIDRREWREYLKSMWLDVLRMKQYFNVARFSNCKLYYRRLLFSISGWLGRSGRNKKN